MSCRVASDLINHTNAIAVAESREDAIRSQVDAEFDDKSASIYDLLYETRAGRPHEQRDQWTNDLMAEFAEELFCSDDPVRHMAQFKEDVIERVVESRLGE